MLIELLEVYAMTKRKKRGEVLHPETDGRLKANRGKKAAKEHDEKKDDKLKEENDGR